MLFEKPTSTTFYKEGILRVHVDFNRMEFVIDYSMRNNAGSNWENGRPARPPLYSNQNFFTVIHDSVGFSL